jgi:hypothetical protein
VSGGDLVAAFNMSPVRIPLPDEPQGEAVAFEPDGTLLSGSETRRGLRGEIRAVAGATGLTGEAEPVAALPPAPEVVPDPGPPSWVPAALGGGTVVGLLLLVAAAASLRGRLRRG